MDLGWGMRTSYKVFGSYGLFLLAKARLLHRPIQVKTSVPRVKHPLYLRIGSSDVPLFREILVNTSEYECELSKSPRVIVDAGANVGFASVFYANKYPEARIIAIEPDASNYEMLRKNTACYSNIVPVHAALWKDNSELVLEDPGTGSWGFQTRDKQESDAAKKKVLVPGITIDMLMARYQIDYIDMLKVDIEGAEKEVFENPAFWIDKVGVIAIELHDWCRLGCSHSVYSAARDFTCERRKGQTTFLMRAEYAVVEAVQASASAESTFRHQDGSLLPVKILNAE